MVVATVSVVLQPGGTIEDERCAKVNFPVIGKRNAISVIARPQKGRETYNSTHANPSARSFRLSSIHKNGADFRAKKAVREKNLTAFLAIAAFSLSLMQREGERETREITA